MRKVIFTCKGTINGVSYNKGSKINVSESIFEDLSVNQKCVKENKKETVTEEK